RLAAQDARQMIGLMLLAAAGDERRPGVVQADEGRGDLGGASACVLLEPDELLHERRAAATRFPRPRDAGPPRLEHRALPREVEGAARPQVGAGRPRPRHVGLEPRARRGTELFLGRAEADLHRRVLSGPRGGPMAINTSRDT